MLSRRARSAIAATLEVARLARGKPLPAKAMTMGRGMAPRQFEVVLQDLVRAGLLRSLRGPHGGYELARERRRITLGDIVRAAEAGRDTPPREQDAVVERAVAEASAAFLAHLDAVTLSDLCREDAGAVLPATSADFHI